MPAIVRVELSALRHSVLLSFEQQFVHLTAARSAQVACAARELCRPDHVARDFRRLRLLADTLPITLQRKWRTVAWWRGNFEVPVFPVVERA